MIVQRVVGVDLGGHHVRASIIRAEDESPGSWVENPSDAREGAARVIARVVETVEQAISEAGVAKDDIAGVGMAVPGHIDAKTGAIIWSPNFGEWIDGKFEIFLGVPFAGPISKALGIPVFAGNDVNVAALGELRYGAGRGVSDMVMFTLGTGIGSGVISSGNLIVGSTGGAVELGHHVIVAGGRQCGCGDFGHLEAYCSAQAIVERAQRAIESGKPTALTALADGERTAITPKSISEAAEAGDRLAQEVFEEIGYYLGIGISNAVCIFNPELIVIGGKIREATGLLEATERSMRAHAVRSIVRTCRIVKATLGDNAGVMGAAELARRLSDCL